MNYEGLVKQVLEEAINKKIFPGGVVGIVSKKGNKIIVPAGRLTYEINSPAVRNDTLYDLASITKSIPGSSIILKLIDDGQLSLDDKVADYIPQFANHKWKSEVSIKNLLTYTIDFLDVPSMSTMKNKSPDEITERIISAPLRNPAGTNYVYGNPTALLTSLIINKVTGRNLDDLAEEFFFGPLGMKQTTFHPKKSDKFNIAPTEIDDDWRKRIIQGEVHDESTFILMKNGPTVIAGLFSTVPDLLIFQEMLLNGGQYAGKRYFSETAIKDIQTNQIDEKVGCVGLGWELNKPSFMGKYADSHTFGKTGFTGCVMVTDPARGKGFVLLSNRTYPKRPENNLPINEVRRKIADIVFSGQ